jgi:hypothetical protein
METPLRNETLLGGLELDHDELGGDISDDVFAGAEDHDAELPDEDLD